MPDVDDGCVGGSVSVEKGFDCGSSGFDIDSLKLAIGVSNESANVSISHLLSSFLLFTPP